MIEALLYGRRNKPLASIYDTIIILTRQRPNKSSPGHPKQHNNHAQVKKNKSNQMGESMGGIEVVFAPHREEKRWSLNQLILKRSFNVILILLLKIATKVEIIGQEVLVNLHPKWIN